jgi:indole-3-acetate monooxygenase
MSALSSLTDPSNDILEIAAEFTDEIKARATEFENQGYVSQDLTDRIAQTGLYRLCNPVEFGGMGRSPIDYAAVTEYLAQQDGSAAWVVFIGITSALSMTNLPEQTAKKLLTENPSAITAGVFAPMGRALPETLKGIKGYRLTGQWSWGSGSRNAKFISGGGFVVDEADDIQKRPDGFPDQRSFFMRTTEVDLLDTWDVSGLKGTGSTDFKVDDLFVPEDMTFDAMRMNTPESPIHSFPIFAFLGVGVCAVGLGLARAAIDELVSFAGAKTPQGSNKPLALKPSTHKRVAEAEADLRSARLFLYDSIGKAWDKALVGQNPSIEDRRDIRLATTHAMNAAVRVVDSMYILGGGTSVYSKSPLQRHFRDVHVASQHMMVSEATLELIGRLFVGLETNTAQL